MLVISIFLLLVSTGFAALNVFQSQSLSVDRYNITVDGQFLLMDAPNSYNVQRATVWIYFTVKERTQFVVLKTNGINVRATAFYGRDVHENLPMKEAKTTKKLYFKVPYALEEGERFLFMIKYSYCLHSINIDDYGLYGSAVFVEKKTANNVYATENEYSSDHCFTDERTPVTNEKVCQKDADCNDPKYGTCDTEFGLCEPTGLKCKLDVFYTPIQPCKLLAHCSTSAMSSSSKSICDSTVMFAEKDVDGSFTVKGFGVAIGPRHILTSIQAMYSMEYGKDKYVISEGTRVHEVQTSKVHSISVQSDINVKKWADFTYIELPESTPINFHSTMDVAAYKPNLPLNPVTFIGDDSTIKVVPDVEFGFNNQTYCEEAFFDDPFEINTQYVTCGSDKTSKFNKVLSGAPVAVKESGNDNYLLFGLRTFPALSLQHMNVFLTTVVGPNCDWLRWVSRGAVVCVDKKWDN
uniref:IgGFc_binding domain-containing protein n=1 Tax=Panagrellus redivivus TaxID=6233 RepID=A0A7E4VJ45_PANRE